MNLSTNFFSKLNSKSQQQSSKPERKVRQYILFNDLVINPEPYEGRDSLLQKKEPGERYVNPKSSFYLCKVIKNEIPFEKLPTNIIRRVAYRKGTKTDQLGRVIYNDAECKNLDQISTEFHCYRLLKQSIRTVQMLCLSHQNTQCAEDRRLYYQVMRLPDRRAQGIKNVMFVLEEMNEGSLKEHIDRIQAKKQDPFTEHEVIEYTCQIVEGLQELKRRGIIHRDLRPENILFHNKQIKISDFDSAFIKGYSDYRNIRNGLLMKDTTPLEIMQLIAEPEDRLKNLTSDELWEIQQHADIYFLGVNIYTMVFSHPFETFNGGKILHNLINIKKRNGFCPKLLDLMARCLEKDVHKRVTLEEVTGRLGEIEKETFYRHATFTRVYTTSDPLNLYNFSSNQIEQKLECEAGDFVAFQNIIRPIEMEEDFQDALRGATVYRQTKYFEPILREILHEKENESIWYNSPSLNLLQAEQRKLRATIEQALERLQIKAFYFELIYRMLCEVNLDRLAVQAEGYYIENVQSHLDLLTSELVVVLTFIYDTLLQSNFTQDPNFVGDNVDYETRRVFESTRVLYARRSYFAGRHRNLTNSFNVIDLTKKLKEFKVEHGATNETEVAQVEEGVNFVIKSIRKVEALEKLIKDFNETEYESGKRKAFWYEYSTLTKFMDKIERVLKSEMVQTIINLIIAYQKMKASKRGSDANLKNAIFMLMILDAQNTNNLRKNDLVIIKEELTRMINFRVGWKAEELEAFFANYTQVHQEEVAQGLHELESQAVLGGGLSTLNIEPEEEDDHNYEVKVVEDAKYEVNVEREKEKEREVVVEELSQPPHSQQRNRKEAKQSVKMNEPKMEVKVSIEDTKEKESNVSFQVEEQPDAEEIVEQQQDNVPEIKIINPQPALKKSGTMEMSQTFEFQIQDNTSFIRSSIPVENVQD